jgi:hypothetical protein
MQRWGSLDTGAPQLRASGTKIQSQKTKQQPGPRWQPSRPLPRLGSNPEMLPGHPSREITSSRDLARPSPATQPDSYQLHGQGEAWVTRATWPSSLPLRCRPALQFLVLERQNCWSHHCPRVVGSGTLANNKIHVSSKTQFIHPDSKLSSAISLL